MKKSHKHTYWSASLAVIAAILLLSGCGSGGTKTTTVTVTSESKKPAAEPEASPEKSGQAAVPTATTIPDGTWKRGEYTPGTYRASGGEGCYWEKEKQPGESLSGLGNGSGETNILLRVDSPYFKTEECGVWRKVG